MYVKNIYLELSKAKKSASKSIAEVLIYIPVVLSIPFAYVAVKRENKNIKAILAELKNEKAGYLLTCEEEEIEVILKAQRMFINLKPMLATIIEHNKNNVVFRFVLQEHFNLLIQVADEFGRVIYPEPIKYTEEELKTFQANHPDWVDEEISIEEEMEYILLAR